MSDNISETALAAGIGAGKDPAADKGLMLDGDMPASAIAADDGAPGAEAAIASVVRESRNEPAALSGPVDPVEIAEGATEQLQGVGEVIRQSAELTLEQSRASYDRMRNAAEEAASNMEAAVTAAGEGVLELNMKAIDAARSTTDASFEFARALAGARTMSDVVVLQSEHLRKQFEAANTMAREFAELATRISARATAPLTDSLGKTFGHAG